MIPNCTQSRESRMSESILLTRDGHVAVLTLSRPQQLNALTRSMSDELAEHFWSLNKDHDTRAIILTGSGGNFCQGGDFSDNEGKIENPVEGRVRLQRGRRLIELMVGGPKPVIGAISGHTIGLGMSIALACDFVVAADNVQFNTGFARLGLAAEYGLTFTLRQRIGLAQTKRLLMLPKKIKAEEALALHLVDTVCPLAELETTALNFAREFAEAPPLVVAYTKAALAKNPQTVQAAMDIEHDYQGALYMTQDHVEAVKASFKKRKPEFTGR